MVSPEDKIELFKKYSFKTVTTADQLHALCVQLKEAKAFAIDTETTGLRPLQDELVGISVCVHEGEAFYIPVGHKSGEQQLAKSDVVAALKPILESESIKKYLHHAKFDQLVLYSAGITMRGWHLIPILPQYW